MFLSDRISFEQFSVGNESNGFRLNFYDVTRIPFSNEQAI